MHCFFSRNEGVERRSASFQAFLGFTSREYGLQRLILSGLRSQDMSVNSNSKAFAVSQIPLIIGLAGLGGGLYYAKEQGLLGDVLGAPSAVPAQCCVSYAASYCNSHLAVLVLLRHTSHGLECSF